MCCLGAILVEPAQLETWLENHSDKRIALLFPPDGEEALTAVPCPVSADHPDFVPEILIVPDGSWSEARRMVRKNSLLRSFPRVSPRLEVNWLTKALRTDKWARPCTAEALGQWIAQSGDESAAQNLRQALVAFVNAHWKSRGIVGAMSKEYPATV